MGPEVVVVQNTLKSWFILVYTSVLMLASVHCIYILGWVRPGDLAWLGAAVAVWPSAMFFIRLFSRPFARTHHNLYGLLLLALLGVILATIGLFQDSYYPWLAMLYALPLGLGGSLAYNYWYSHLGREPNEQLQVGQPLPHFTLHDVQGQPVSTAEITQTPALLLFFRGNWCPLCMAQIKEIAEQYQQLQQRGVTVYLISPQPEENTQALAKRFAVPFQFLVDGQGKVAEQLGLLSQSGTPVGVTALGYESDTVFPTALITDAQGQIIFADLTDNYRVRPEPETFLRILDQHKLGVPA